MTARQDIEDAYESGYNISYQDVRALLAEHDAELAAIAQPATSFDKLYKDNAQGIEIERLKMVIESMQAQPASPVQAEPVNNNPLCRVKPATNAAAPLMPSPTSAYEFKYAHPAPTAQASQTVDPAKPWAKERGYHALVQVIYELQNDGNYSDDEGEETKALTELVLRMEEADAAPVAQPVQPTTLQSRLERIAATGTADSFMALPDAQKRLWFASYVNESSLRKKALLSLEEYEHAPSHVGRERCVIEAVAYLSGLTIAQPAAVGAVEQLAARAPDGMVTVPREPTDAMLCALMQWDPDSGLSILPLYRAMITAEPLPPESVGVVS